MILFNNITVKKQGRTLLHSVRGAVESGNFLGIVGANGSGKTTLLRVMAGLMLVQAGECFLKGKSLRQHSPACLHKLRAYLPAERTCHWNLLGHDILDIMEIERGSRAPLFKKTETQDLLHRSYQSLSMGEKSRLLLTCTLAMDRDLVFLDEPLFALDPRHQIRMMALLKAQAMKGKTIIAVFHELSLVRDFCDKTWLMRQGEILSAGPAKQVLTSSVIQEGYDLNEEEALYFLRDNPLTETMQSTLKVGEVKDEKSENDAIDGKRSKGEFAQPAHE